MDRYVVRFQGIGEPTEDEVNRLREVPGLQVLDAAGPHMMLVQAPSEAIDQVKEMSAWNVSAETYVPVPDTRKKLRDQF